MSSTSGWSSAATCAGAWLADQVDAIFWHDWFHDSVLAAGFRWGTVGWPSDSTWAVIDGAWRRWHGWSATPAGGLRRVQTGYVRNYAASVLLGVVLHAVVSSCPIV